MIDQGEIAVYLMYRCRCSADAVGYALREEEGEWVFVKSAGVSGPGTCGEQPRRGKSLAVDDGMVTSRPDLSQQPPKPPVLILFFVPDQHLSEVGMPMQQAFIAFSEQEINLCMRIGSPQLLDEGSGQHHVADECCLDDQDVHAFLGAKVNRHRCGGHMSQAYVDIM